MWHRKLKIRLCSLKTNILREGSQGTGMQMYRAKRVLILPFAKTCIMTYKYSESLSSSQEWNMMVNAHNKRRREAVWKHWLLAMFCLVVCFVFYFTQKFFFSSFVNSCGQWCMAQSALIEIGFLHHLEDVLWVLFGLSLSHAISRGEISKQHQGTQYETGGLNTAPGRKKSRYIHSQCLVNGFCRKEHKRNCSFLCMLSAVFKNSHAIPSIDSSLK